MRSQDRIAKLKDAAAVTSCEPLATLISFGRHASSSRALVVLFDGRDSVALDRKGVESTGQFLARVKQSRSGLKEASNELQKSQRNAWKCGRSDRDSRTICMPDSDAIVCINAVQTGYQSNSRQEPSGSANRDQSTGAPCGRGSP